MRHLFVVQKVSKTILRAASKGEPALVVLTKTHITEDGYKLSSIFVLSDFKHVHLSLECIYATVKINKIELLSCQTSTTFVNNKKINR